MAGAAIEEKAKIICPKCASENSDTAYFCTTCHAILMHRCPNCWHEQRDGTVCEKCGTNFALYWQLQLQEAMEEENRLWWDKLGAAIGKFLQIVSLPFYGLAGVIRALVLRFIVPRLLNR
jgi:hypothetical protein